MKKQSKFKLSMVMATLSLASVLAAGSAVISCNNSGGGASIQAVYSKNQFVIARNLQKNIQSFQFDPSRSYGVFQAVDNGQMVDGTPLREKYEGQEEVTSILVKQENNPKPVSVQLINKPTYRSLKLILAKAFILTFADGTTKVYDNDKAEVLPEAKEVTYTLADGKTKTYKVFNNVTESKTSDDLKSINNPTFLNDLQRATKFQFVLKPDLHWVNYKGEKTKYQIVPKDFYYSWLRTQSINQEFRDQNGGTTELDKLASNVCEKNTISFTDSQHYQNDYIFNIYNIDASKFFNESEFIESVVLNDNNSKEEKAVTFCSKDSQSARFDQFLPFLYSDYTFMPAPSQYIDEMNKNSKNIPVLSFNNEENNETNSLKESIGKMNKESIMYKIGAYWYGIGSKNSLYSGPYYPTPTNDLNVVLQKNKYYEDEEFINDKNTVNKIIYSYLQKPEPLEDFSKRLWNYYQQGTTSLTPYSQLSDPAKEIINKDPKKMGLRFTQILNTNQNVCYMVQSAFLNKAPRGNIDNYGFNDAYAKMMWGATRKEINEGKFNPNVFLNGTGLSFRSLLNAAINWSEYVKQYSSDQNKVWLTKIAPDSKIGYKDDNQKEQPVSYYEKINSLFAIDKDGNKVNFSNNPNEEDYLISPEENIKINENKDNVETKLESVGFEILKQKMNELIAEFDKKNPDFAGEPFTYNYFFPYTNPQQTLKDAAERISKIAEKLNSRIKVKLVYWDNPDTSPEYNDYKLNGANGSQPVNWSYDFNGIGSGYDAFSWGIEFIPMLVQIATSTEENSNVIKNNFPEIFKLAKGLMTYEKGDSSKSIEAHPFNTSVPLEELNKVSNSIPVSLFVVALQNYVLEKDSQTGLYSLKRNDEHKPIRATETYTDLYAYSSKFWLYYINTLTKDEVVNLMQEMTNFMSINYPFGTSIPKNKFARTLVNEHYIYPSQLGEDWTQYQDIRIKNQEK